MKLRFLLLLPVLFLSGCLGVLTGSTSNPLTPRSALILHATFDGGVVVAAGDYAGLPRCPAPAPCSQQSVVNTLRIYVNKAEDTLRQLDQWALGNTSLNGVALYQAALIAVQTAQSFAISNGLSFAPAQGT